MCERGKRVILDSCKTVMVMMHCKAANFKKM